MTHAGSTLTLLRAAADLARVQRATAAQGLTIPTGVAARPTTVTPARTFQEGP